MRFDPDDPAFQSLGREIDERSLRRAARATGITLAILGLFVVLLATINPYADFLWYLHDAKRPEVFRTAYGSRGLLFVLAFVPTLLLVYFSLKTALSLTLVYISRPDAGPAQVMSSLLGWVQERGLRVVKVVSPLVAFFAALSFSGQWSTFLLSRNVQSFGVKDPAYGLDLGFYLFSLPWYRAIASYVLSLLLVTGLLTLGIYMGLQSLAMLARIELSRPHVRTHLSVLAAAFLAVLGVQTWLKTFEIGLIPGPQFTGAGYAASLQASSERVLAVLMLLAAVGALVNARAFRPYRLIIGSAIVLGLYFAVGVLGVRAVANVGANADRLGKESPFVARAIKMTRFGYDLERIEVRDLDVAPAPSAEQVAVSTATLDNMRLWDPEVLRMTLENLQGLRRYYAFNDVDIDRYMIGGKQRQVMIAPRDLDPDGIPPEAQNWTYQRLRYTHGYGVVVTQVNAATAEGRPAFLTQGIPISSPKELAVTEPRIYFSDTRDARGMPTDDYAIVNSKIEELDYQVGTESVTHQWTGGRGVPVGSVLARLAYAIRLADVNLVISPNITRESRLLVRRNVLERAAAILPFLRFDADPYLVVYQGRLIWMLDGYSVSDQVPYSAMVPGGGLNYIRNSAKVTVDAYTGEVRAFALLPDEPILKAWRSIYPGLVEDLDRLPKGLDANFRYPEDLLTVQSRTLAQYHVQDPVAFLSNADSWEVAYQRGLTGNKMQILPYYVTMQLPDEDKSGFLQILPFTTRGKPNMSGWLAAHCDPGDYGRLTMYRFNQGTPPPGPELMESNFNSDPAVSYVNRTYTNDQSEIIVGNLLVVPIGNSVMYVEPLFLRSRTQGIQAAPRLFKVILALSDRIVVADTYRQALDQLFGSGAGKVPTGAASQPVIQTGTGAQPATGPAKEALDLLDQANNALKSGDFGKYGELQKQLRAKLAELAGAVP